MKCCCVTLSNAKAMLSLIPIMANCLTNRMYGMLRYIPLDEINIPLRLYIYGRQFVSWKSTTAKIDTELFENNFYS